jgi:hypothetical protein
VVLDIVADHACSSSAPTLQLSLLCFLIAGGVATSDPWMYIAGWVGLVSSGFAVYAGAAELLKEEWGYVSLLPAAIQPALPAGRHEQLELLPMRCNLPGRPPVCNPARRPTNEGLVCAGGAASGQVEGGARRLAPRAEGEQALDQTGLPYGSCSVLTLVLGAPCLGLAWATAQWHCTPQRPAWQWSSSGSD